MKYLQWTIFVVTIYFLTNIEVFNGQEISPCPRLFTYERRNASLPDRWYGILTLLKESDDLKGIWLRVIFDRPILQLGNWFGEVVKRSANHTDYLIKNPMYMLKAHMPKVIRFFVKYNVDKPPPKLIEFRINGVVMCPEGIVTTTTSTTTEHLFTSLEEDGTPDAFISHVIHVVATTTAGPEVREMSNAAVTAEIEKPPPLNVNVKDICGTVVEQNQQGKPPGQVAYKGQFPWHAMLYYLRDINISYLCGAVLVSKNHVVTVAHCVIKSNSLSPVDAERLVVYLGKYYVKHWSPVGVQTQYVSKIATHPNYNPNTYDYDVAVLELTSEVEFTNYVRPICLWKESTDLGAIESRPGTVTGWGFNEKGNIEEKLMFVQMTVEQDDVCNKSIANYYDRFKSHNTYCANFVSDDVECVGDSGGGMAFPALTDNQSKPVWQLRGLVTVSVVVQHQLKCDRSRHVVFTDVAKYTDWIKQKANLN